MFYEEEIITPTSDDGGVDLSEKDDVEDSEVLPEDSEEEGEEVEE